MSRALVTVSVGATLLLLAARPLQAQEHKGEERAATKKLELSDFDLVFSDEFDKPLDVSAWGPSTRWIAHTPWKGDFGDAAFDDPAADHPFQVKDGVLRIEARKMKHALPGVRPWRSGLLASNDPKGRGFSLQYGYFEICAKLPDSKGVWPAFWLSSSFDRTRPEKGADGSVEIDVLEFYGFKEKYHVNLHVWSPRPHRTVGKTIDMPKHDAGTNFHTYGVLVTPQKITFYRDRQAKTEIDTPQEHNKPLMILLNLALGGGWPIDAVKDPSFMYVDYVRAYAFKKPLAAVSGDETHPADAAHSTSEEALSQQAERR